MSSNSKKTLETLVVGGVLVISLNNAHGTLACSNGSAVGTVAGSSALFVKSSFAPKCSANVLADYIDGTVNFGVKSGSIKGNQTYGGSTEGGSVSVCTTFTGTLQGVTATTTVGC